MDRLTEMKRLTWRRPATYGAPAFEDEAWIDPREVVAIAANRVVLRHGAVVKVRLSVKDIAEQIGWTE